MEIVVVRHAVAEKRDPLRWPDDSARPLTGRGEARFVRAAHGLAVLVPDVDRLLASPFVRTWRTAELLHDVAGWPVPERCPELAEDRAPHDALAALARCRLDSRLAVVGHEPMLSELVSLLLTGTTGAVRLELGKGAVAVLSLAAALEPGQALLRSLVTPRTLRAIAG